MLIQGLRSGTSCLRTKRASGAFSAYPLPGRTYMLKAGGTFCRKYRGDTLRDRLDSVARDRLSFTTTADSTQKAAFFPRDTA
jgi:hypothetical protein